MNLGWLRVLSGSGLMLAAVASVAAQTTGDAVPVVVRVQGLALGNVLQLRHAGSTLTATLNDQYTFANAALSGAPLDLQVTVQPLGQQCALSTLAPSVVPADSAPIFVRCRHLPAARIVMPTTLPDNPLAILLGTSAMRARAYPGLPYESRMGVVGGIFPYEFRLTALSLNGAPQSLDGVSIDFRRGTLRFTPMTAGTYTFQMEIRDSGSSQRVLAHTFAITAATTDFVFVAPYGVDATGRGSLAQPYRSLAYALARTTSSQLIMLRKGTYVTGGFGVDDSHAKQFLAYPDEVVTLDLDHAGWISVNIDQAPAARFEDLDIQKVQQYGFFSDPSKSGLVIRNVRFVDGREGPVTSENPAYVHGRSHNLPDPRHALLVQDNDFSPLQMVSSGTYAMTLFDAGDSLIENNQMRVGTNSGAVHDKDNSQRNTYRENYIEFAAGAVSQNGIQISAQANSEKVHIHHNLLVNGGMRLGLQCFQETCYMRDHDVHHNTISGPGVLFGWGIFNPTSAGTRISHNIMRSNAVAPYAWHSCLGSVPAAFTAQVNASGNRFETTSTRAMRDTECTGGPMNLSWAAWQNTHGLDSNASGSVVSSTSDLTGAGPTLGLPINDARRPLLGHLYTISSSAPDDVFRNGFE